MKCMMCTRSTFNLTPGNLLASTEGAQPPLLPVNPKCSTIITRRQR